MLDMFAEYERQLFNALYDPVKSDEGAAIQRERLDNSRSSWIRETLAKAFQGEGLSPLIEALKAYVSETEVPEGDFGYWGELTQFVHFIGQSALPYELKSRIFFFAACLAAQQIEAAEDISAGIPYLADFVGLFQAADRQIYLSSYGYPGQVLKAQGIVAIYSVNGKVRTRIASTFLRQEVITNLEARIQALAVRHGWQIGADRQERFHACTTYAGFFGICELEFESFLASERALRPELTSLQLAQAIYPMWLPNSLALTITYFCNASCNHCYNASGSFRPQQCIQWKQVEHDLTAWIALGVNEFGISGGEPFLFPDQVIEIVRGLKALGVKTVRPFSNGFWGANREKAVSILTRLKEVGFGNSPTDRLKVSVGEFHQKDISVRAVLDLCQYHFEVLGTRCELDVEQVFQENLIRQIITLAKERGLHDKIEWRLRQKVSNSGRAKGWFQEVQGERVGLQSLTCPVSARAALYPEGAWVYCTGTTFPKNFLALGQMAAETPYGILAKAQMDHRLPYLQFGTFFDYAKDRGLDTSQTLSARATACSICPKIFSSPSGGTSCA